MQKIKLYGERNTGSRYLVKLLKKNFDAELLRYTVPNNILWYRREWTKNLYFWLTYRYNFGWKHAYVRTDWLKPEWVENTGFITVSKNPYSYLLSLYKRPYHVKGDKPATFLDFLQREWKLQERDNMPVSSLPNPVVLWNQKNRSYMNLQRKFPERVYNMTYEGLLDDYARELRAVQEKLDLQPLGDYTNVTESTKEDAKSNDYYRDYYLGEVWRKDLNADQIAFINEQLDPEVMAFFGYAFQEAKPVA